MAEFIKIEHEGITGYGHVTREALSHLPGWTEVKEEESPEDATVAESPVEPAPGEPATAVSPTAPAPEPVLKKLPAQPQG